jgi:hypothetical protein
MNTPERAGRFQAPISMGETMRRNRAIAESEAK